MRSPRNLWIAIFSLMLLWGLAACTVTQVEPGPAGTPQGPVTTSSAATSAPPASPSAQLPPTSQPVTPLPPEEAQNLWQRIQAQGVMTVGVASNYPPFVYESSGGALDGLDVALMETLAQKLGVSVAFQRIPFPDLLAKVQAGEVQAAIGGLSVTPARSQQVAFTQPYLTGSAAILLTEASAQEEFTSMEALAQRVIAAQAGTVFADWLRQQAEAGAFPADHIRLYADLHQAVDALIAGKVDMVLLDFFTAQDVARQTFSQLQLLNKRGKVTLTYRPLLQQPLHHTQWELRSYANDQGQLVPALTGVHVTAQIDDAVIKGSAGCNTYSTDILIKKSSIRITPPVTTRKTCADPEGIMKQEDQFLKNLRHSEAYQIQGDVLVFLDKEGRPTLIFQAQPEVQLENTIWDLEAYGPLRSPSFPPAHLKITLQVDKKGQISGFSGCNRYTGKATHNQDAVHIELGASSTKACDEEANSLEAAYLTALASAERAEIQQDRLLLYYNGGLDALKFRARRQNPLQSTQWELQSFGDPEKGKLPLETTQLTALFGPQKLTGSAGCNVFSTSYAVSGEKIQIGPIKLTRKLCPDEKVTAQEQTYVKALRNSVRYRLARLRAVEAPFYQQAYAIAVPLGADALVDALNQALAELESQGDLEALRQRYLTALPPATAPEPETTPTPACTDKMKWIADLTYDDKNMKKPPVIQPGTPFTKTWRVKNVGTCTWTTDYYMDFVRGNKPGADMRGERTFLAQEVPPGKTYDLSLKLVAPTQPGVYQGFWQFFNPQGEAFAELWVGIKVPKPATPFPTPTPTPPSPILQLVAESTHIQQGACTTLYWNVQGANEVYLFPKGGDPGDGVLPQGSQEVCPQQTTTYVLSAVLPDGSHTSTSLTIVVSAVEPPQILRFTADPSDQVVLGQPVHLQWEVGGDVQQVQLLANDIPLDANAPIYGSWIHYPETLGTIKYTLKAQGPGGVSVTDLLLQVVKSPGPETPSPTATPLPPTQEPQPTATPLPPTEEPQPTATSLPPTEAPQPTATPLPPTEEPQPTATLLPPTEEPQPTPPPGLIGPVWSLVSWAKAKMAPTPVLEGTQITLQWGADGVYQGQSGCNIYRGTYHLGAEGALTMDIPGVTRRQCASPEGIMDQEATYLSLLPRVVGYELDSSGQQLILRTEDHWQLTFQHL